MTKYLTAQEVCSRYRISSTSLWRYERDPEIAFPKALILKRNKLFDREEIEEWERRTKASEPSIHSDQDHGSGLI